MNPNARTLTIEVLVNDDERDRAKAVCKRLGIGLSTWYRGLGNAEAQRHGMPPAPPKESRGCRGIGKVASRASGTTRVRRQL